MFWCIWTGSYWSSTTLSPGSRATQLHRTDDRVCPSTSWCSTRCTTSSWTCCSPQPVAGAARGKHFREEQSDCFKRCVITRGEADPVPQLDCTDEWGPSGSIPRCSHGPTPSCPCDLPRHSHKNKGNKTRGQPEAALQLLNGTKR